MGCNCGKKAGTVQRARTVTGAAGDSAVVAGTSPRFRTRVRFFVVPPPEESGEELVFDTLYEARAALGQREGWRLESRRVERAG